MELAAVLVPAVTVLWGQPPFSWSVAACLLLPLRHVFPPLAVLGGLWGLAGGLGWPAAIVSLYRLGRRNGRVSGTLPWLVLPVVAAVTPVLVTQELSWQRIVLTLAYVTLNAVAPAFVGLLMNTRDRLTSSLHELEQARGDALAASQDAARAQERARIGREIHDAVGHPATLIAVGAAALAASTREESTREAAETIRGLAKRALAEMRVALGLADGRGEPHAGLAEMAALVGGARAAGVDAVITHHGEPSELAPGVGRAVYRVVQESLTTRPGTPRARRCAWTCPGVPTSCTCRSSTPGRPSPVVAPARPSLRVVRASRGWSSASPRWAVSCRRARRRGRVHGPRHLPPGRTRSGGRPRAGRARCPRHLVAGGYPRKSPSPGDHGWWCGTGRPPRLSGSQPPGDRWRTGEAPSSSGESRPAERPRIAVL